jgi:hypothetical protein
MLKTPYLFIAALMISASAPALAETISAANTLVELGNQLTDCVDHNSAWPSSGDITVAFSLRRDGSLIGRPHVSYIRTANAGTRQQLVNEVAAILDQCLPAKITDGLGGAIAGRMYSWYFVVRGKENGI